MQTLRNTRYLARLVLAWFVLALGVAVAAPVVHPKSMELVCASGGAVKLVVTAADGSVSNDHGHTLDCPLCLIEQPAPLPTVAASLSHSVEPTHAVQHLSLAEPTSYASAPPPSRGPPASL